MLLYSTQGHSLFIHLYDTVQSAQYTVLAVGVRQINAHTVLIFYYLLDKDMQPTSINLQPWKASANFEFGNFGISVFYLFSQKILRLSEHLPQTSKSCSYRTRSNDYLTLDMICSLRTDLSGFRYSAPFKCKLQTALKRKIFIIQHFFKTLAVVFMIYLSIVAVWPYSYA